MEALEAYRTVSEITAEAFDDCDRAGSQTLGNTRSPRRFVDWRLPKSAA